MRFLKSLNTLYEIYLVMSMDKTKNFLENDWLNVKTLE